MVFSVGKSSYSSSCSTSNPPRSWIYHVFVSFRGDDTRNGFTDHLFASLERKGIKVFRDDKDLKRGEVISQELLKAIEESMFAIVILSPNYASSTWCLDELQNIVECSKKVQVLPVFYGVDPSAVRHQRESFEEAFKKHEDRFGRGSYKIQRWIHALTQVAAYSGWNSNNLREAKLVDDIVQHIHKSLIPKLPSCIENLVGIASRVEEVNKFIGMELNDVRFIGIWGMGGVENKGTEAIQGIVLNLLEPYEARWCTEAFSKTNQLNFLILNDMKLHFGLNHFPSSLKVLHWRRCSLETLPLTNRVYEFVHIKLSHSKIEQLWHGKKILEKLKYMDLSFSNNLKQLPDFSGIPSIETLDLKGCTSLSKVHPSLLHLKKLVTLNLEDCTSLKTLPCKLEMSSLKKLILSGCSAFKNLPGFGESMKHLSMLSLQGTSIRNLPTSLGCLAGLKVLDLKDCKLLVSLPNTFHELWSLKKLYLSNCYKFRNLPEFGESMIHLSRLRLDGTAIRELPSSIGCLVSLAHLKLRYCKKLVCLPDTIVALKSLTYLSTYGCSKLGKLSVGESHRMVPRSMNWKQPQKLGLRHSILNLASLITLDISYCNLSEKSFPHDLCNLPPLLEYLYMDGNHFASVPMNISNLSKLRYLSLCSCRKLQKLPELPSSIRKLDAISCVSLETSKFNPCSLFATHGEYPPKVRDSFDMVITGSEIPAWFDHQEDGEHVSTPRDCPTSDWVGIFMCFLIIRYADPSERFHYEVKCCLDSRVGKCFKKRTLPHLKSGRPELYILFLAPSHGEISWHKNRFGLFQTAKVYRRVSDCQYPNLMDLKVVSCGSRWLDKQDIAVLKNGDQKLQYPDSEAFVSRDSEIQHVDWEDDE
ncbi:hypothetical protein RJT34_18019 [Clitoria ternatea]|uniref:TIR domain-containing protein n=1 Tax=Clitoria ternatea TaxID=43366 RepID=A0AAN9PDM4_CLITE